MNGVKTESAASSGSVVPIESAQEGQLAALVAALSEATNGLRRQTHECPTRQPLPSRDAVIEIVEALRSVLFPGYFGASEICHGTLPSTSAAPSTGSSATAGAASSAALAFVCESETRRRATNAPEGGPGHRRASCSGCPQSGGCWRPTSRPPTRATPPPTQPDEAIFCYPGLLAVTNYRHRPRALRAGGAADPADDHRARPQHHRHRHPPRRDHRRGTSSSTTAPAW